MSAAVAAVIAYAACIAIPVIIFAGVIHPNYLATWALAGAWMGCLMFGACASAGDETEAAR